MQPGSPSRTSADTRFGERPAAAVGERVVVGLSGGVDSAVSAWLLKRQGYEVVGLFMKNWEDDDDGEFCSTRQDWLDAASVADVIGIDVEAVNFAAEYKDRVFAEFLREYSAGRTPNPDVLCNAEIKFRAFLDHALRLGAERIATGHYARVRQGRDGNHQLLRGVDPGKDQSYFLHRLDRQQLSRVLFPLGGLHKAEVRRIAADIGLPNAAKRDSTGICFIGERPFRQFLSRYLPTRPGPIRDDGGAVIGEHVGLAFYTLGQRKGIGIGGLRDSSGDPWYVARKDVDGNALYVVQGHDHPWLLSRSLQAQDAHWIGPPPEAGRSYGVKTRYRQPDAAATAHAFGSGIRIDFAAPQWAVTPGQSVVVYDGEVCLGGGVIATARPPFDGRSETVGRRRGASSVFAAGLLAVAAAVSLVSPGVRAQEPRPARPAVREAPAPTPAGRPAPAREAQAREAQVRGDLLIADGLGQLASTLRAYAQLGHQVEPEQARERLTQSRGEFDQLLAQLSRREGKQVPQADIQRLQQRWRSVRDATYTRPAPDIGALMSDIGEDIAGQLRGWISKPKPGAAANPQLERSWQRQNLQWLAKEALFGCWRADLVHAERVEQLKDEFSRWLATQEKLVPQVTWVQYNSQWNLLSTSLSRAGATGCTDRAMQSVVGSTDRLVLMIGSLH